MNTIIIGNIHEIDFLFPYLEKSDFSFELSAIYVDDTKVSNYKSYPAFPVNQLADFGDFDLIDAFFICNEFMFNKYKAILSSAKIPSAKIYSGRDICKFLKASDKMDWLEKYIKKSHQDTYSQENIKVGAFTYGIPKIKFPDDAHLSIGKFCSIGSNVEIYLGGEHHTEWISTFPFSIFVDDYNYLGEKSFSKGDVHIGNDVWIGDNAKIMSGVSISDGAVIAANAVVTSNVPPYTIVGGVPAKKIRARFDNTTIQSLLEIQWWDWEYDKIYKAIPLIQSSDINKLINF